MSNPIPPHSVFERIHDAVVFGGGCAGLAAARGLVAQGLRVLLVEPSGQLLHEVTRCLAHRLDEDDATPSPEAAFWAEPGERMLDPALAEIRAARWLGDEPGAEALFYVMPLAAKIERGEIAAVEVATKSGPRTLRARLWIDASETGLLTRLVAARTRIARRPSRRLHTLVLHAPDWAAVEARLLRLCRETGASLLATRNRDERRLVWAAGEGSWHAEMAAWLRRLREAAPIPSPVVVSQCSVEALPIYGSDAAAGVADASPANLRVASPGFVAGRVATLADRFALGAGVASGGLSRAMPRVEAGGCGAPVGASDTMQCEVLVVGAGTAGALAALGSARAGARTHVLDLAAFPGGVGTGAGITAYFHGKGGGLHLEIDRATAAWSLLLEGRELPSRRWHHEAKKLALMERFERENVSFLGGCITHSVDKDERGCVRSVLVATARGPVRIAAAAFVDSTGDGDLCQLAGADHVSGRSGDGRTLAYSQSAFVLRETAAGSEVASRNFDAGWTDSTDPEDLSRARLEGVVQHAPDEIAGRDRLLAISPLPGIRQSRQIITDYTLTFRDLVNHARFADGVGEFESIADTHSVDFEFEDDEVFFFYCVCRLFRRSLRARIPYRVLLPRGLANVWIACRAAGLEPAAAYAVRMQRDMQLLGEIAGRAAARAALAGLASRDVAPERLGDLPHAPSTGQAEAEAGAEPGSGGMALWRAWIAPRFEPGELPSQPDRDEAARSFYEAAVLAMRNDRRAAARLLRAIDTREEGPPPSVDNTGAHGQEIDLPFWFIAIVLLRRCGGEECLESFRRLAAHPGLLLNVRTALALTLERLAAGGAVEPGRAAEIADKLVADVPPDVLLAPSRSTWRALRGAPQIRLRNEQGVDTRQDHGWQLHLVVARVRALAGLGPRSDALAFWSDSRAWVRNAFSSLEFNR